VLRLALTWKTVNDYNKNIAARLNKLAAAQSTGLLPITGATAGTVYFQDGAVVYAESSGTQNQAAGRPSWAALEPENGPAPAGQAGSDPPSADPQGGPATSGLRTGLLEFGLGEGTVDAALDLLSSRSACSRFRSVKLISARPAPLSISVAELLTEVSRRQRLLTQLAGVTADTAVMRSTCLDLPRVQVSAMDWALLIRVRTGSTPRDLAWELGQSVFSTTAEVHRLMTLGLLSVAGDSSGGKPASSQVRSFLRALSDEKGGSAMPKVIRSVSQRRGGA
jgi:Domain of unknown function (DUF4388)